MKLTQKERDKLMELFTADNLDEESIDMAAKKVGLDEDKVKEFAYRCTFKLIRQFLYAGKSKGRKPNGVSSKEIAMGKKVEMEHTPNPNIALKITYDHLTEFKDYYTRLAKMEQEAKNG